MAQNNDEAISFFICFFKCNDEEIHYIISLIQINIVV